MEPGVHVPQPAPLGSVVVDVGSMVSLMAGLPSRETFKATCAGMPCRASVIWKRPGTGVQFDPSQAVLLQTSGGQDSTGFKASVTFGLGLPLQVP